MRTLLPADRELLRSAFDEDYQNMLQQIESGQTKYIDETERLIKERWVPLHDLRISGKFGEFTNIGNYVATRIQDYVTGELNTKKSFEDSKPRFSLATAALKYRAGKYDKEVFEIASKSAIDSFEDAVNKHDDKVLQERITEITNTPYETIAEILNAPNVQTLLQYIAWFPVQYELLRVPPNFIKVSRALNVAIFADMLSK